MGPTIGYQGTEGAFSEEAARAVLGRAWCRGFETFDELVAAVDRKEVTYGLLPVENTIYGSIARSYDLLSEHRNVRIVDETSSRISQCLIGLEGTDLGGITRVSSHPVALDQCRRFLKQLSRAEVVVESDTAAAIAGVIQRGDVSHAAIGSQAAAERYGGAILAAGIQDASENYTRFFLIERDGHPRRNRGKACMTLTLPHTRGSLRDALGVLADAECNLTALVARPDRRGPFNYIFYVEFVCAGKAQPLDVLRSLGSSARLLGMY